MLDQSTGRALNQKRRFESGNEKVDNGFDIVFHSTEDIKAAIFRMLI